MPTINSLSRRDAAIGTLELQDLLEALENGGGKAEATDDVVERYRALYNTGLVQSAYYPRESAFYIALTGKGVSLAASLRDFHAFFPLGGEFRDGQPLQPKPDRFVPDPRISGNLSVLLMRLGYETPGRIIQPIRSELCRAHEKFPEFAESVDAGLRYLGEEFGEVCKAVNDGEQGEAVKELAQVVTVSIRLMDMMLSQQEGA